MDYFVLKKLPTVVVQVSPPEASTYCAGLGGYLAEPRTQDIQDFLVPWVTFMGVDFWIGLTDQLQEGR